MRSARRDSAGGIDEPRRQSEVFEGVQHTGCVSGPVVDDGDHPRRRVANPVLLARGQSELATAPMLSVMRLSVRHRHPRCSFAGRGSSSSGAAARACVLGRPASPHAAAPPPPSDGSPGSAGVPIVGQSRLTRRPARRVLPAAERAGVPRHGRDAAAVGEMFVTEGNRYNVRGDIAFAQSIVETAWFNFPDNGMVRPNNNNFAGIGACDSCGNGYQFSSALAGVRGQLQLLRNYADSRRPPPTSPTRPSPSCGEAPPPPRRTTSTTTSPRDAPLWNHMGNGNWATAPNYATGCSASTTRCSPTAVWPVSARPTDCSSVRSPPRDHARSGCGNPVAPSRPHRRVAPT